MNEITSSLASNLLAQEAQGGGIGSLLILLLPMALLVYVMVIPQRRQRKQHQELMSKLAVGDEVVTNAGIYGVITHIEDGVAHLEVDADVVIRVSLGSVTRRTTDPDPAERPARGGRKAQAANADDGTDG